MFRLNRLPTRLFVCFLLLALLIASCAPAAPAPVTTEPAGQTAPTSAPAQAEPVSIQFWEAGPGYEPVTQKSLAEFEKEHPEIKVDLKMLDWGTYIEEILAGVASGNPPDLLMFHSVDLAPFASKGFLEPLDSIITKSDWSDAAINDGTWNGNVYAISWGMQLRALYSRMDFLEEAGYTKPPETWDELIEYSQKVVVRDSDGNITREGFWTPTGHWYKTIEAWQTFLISAGGKMFDENGKAVFNSPEGVESAQFFCDFVTKYQVSTPGAINDDGVDFIQGKYAMGLSNSTMVGMQQQAPELIEVTGISLPPYKTNPNIELAGHLLGIPQNSKHKDEAQTLLLWLATTEAGGIAHDREESMFPSYKPLQGSEYVSTDPFLPKLTPLLEYARPIPKHPDYTEISTIVTAALDDICLNGKPAQEALDDAASQSNTIIGK